MGIVSSLILGPDTAGASEAFASLFSECKVDYRQKKPLEYYAHPCISAERYFAYTLFFSHFPGSATINPLFPSE